MNIINNIPLKEYDSLNIFNDLTIDLSEFCNTKLSLKLKKIKIKQEKNIMANDDIYEMHNKIYREKRNIIKNDDIEFDKSIMPVFYYLYNYVDPFYYTHLDYSQFFLTKNNLDKFLKTKKNKKLELLENVSMGAWKSWEIYFKFNLTDMNKPITTIFCGNYYQTFPIESFILYREQYSNNYYDDNYYLYNFSNIYNPDKLPCNINKNITQMDFNNKILNNFIDRYKIICNNENNDFFSTKFLNNNNIPKCDCYVNYIYHYNYNKKTLCEQHNSLIFLANIIFIFEKLNDGGSCLINFRELEIILTTDILYILTTLFEKAYIFKSSNDRFIHPTKNFIGLNKKKNNLTFKNAFYKLYNKIIKNQSKYLSLQNDNNSSISILKYNKKNKIIFYKLIKKWTNFETIRKINIYNDIYELYLKINKKTKAETNEILENYNALRISYSKIWFNRYNISLKKKIKNYFQYKKFFFSVLESINNNYTYKFFKLSKNTIKNINIKKDFYLKKNILSNITFSIISDNLMINRSLDAMSGAQFSQIMNNISISKKLKKIINEKKYIIHDVEISQAFLKMTEILHKFKLVNNKKNIFKSFHFCESPGQFILATDYYLSVNCPNIKKWEWHAQSLNWNSNIVKKKYGNSGLRDDYGLIKTFSNNWIFGKDNSGDIMNLEQVDSYLEYTKGVQLITSDCGIGISKEMYSSREKYYTKITISTMFTILYTLPKGGNCVIKVFLPFTKGFLLSYLYIYYMVFSEITIFKPSVNPESQEVYLVCNNYNKLSKKDIIKLRTITTNFNWESDNYKQFINLNKKLEYIFQYEKILKNFMYKHTDNAKNILFFYYNDSLINKFKNMCSNGKKEIINKWFKKHNIKKQISTYLNY